MNAAFCVSLRTGYPTNLDIVAASLLINFQILQHKLGLHLKDFHDVFRIKRLCHHPHKYHTIGSIKFVWLHLNGSNTADFYQQTMRQHGAFVFDLPHAEEIKNGLYEIIFSYRNQLISSETKISYKIYGLLTALVDNCTSENNLPDENDPVACAIRFIQ